MDLNTMQEELRKLSEIVAGWSASRRIEPLERDLALEKLRGLYDAVRFGAKPAAGSEPMAAPVVVAEVAAAIQPETIQEQTVAEPASESAPVSIDLDDMLALEPEPVVLAQIETAVTAASEPDEEPEPSVTVASESDEEPTEKPESEHEQPTLEATPLAASVAPATAEAEPSASNSEPEVVVPSLFGPEEEEALRHRRKQRVIMSLYDTTPAPAPTPVPTPAPAPVAEPVVEEFTPNEEQTPAPESEEPVFEPVTPEPESPATIVPETVEEVAMPEPTDADDELEIIEPDVPAVAAESEQPQTEEPEADRQPVSETSGTVLGEVINHNVQTLADTLAASQPDMASALRHNEKITDLRAAIGINDKFLMIRDLFGGDAAAYESGMEQLNAFDNLDDCMIHIAETYTWNPNCDGAKLIMELLERKFA